ncbi:hypothetical protein [Sphingomonas sp. R1]|uniref:hypothetical protein n=1 Tax=Sphingomonas sp. R1 TaxID=399176 RepID=UPI0022255EC3|nr:hypothetical protein [Sphingomonas sp. R1]UYY76427.1 hypothetical protein OIM94_12965 [Sphingomonas sp. R1]
MTDTVSAPHTIDIDLVLQDLERFTTFADMAPATPRIVEQFYATLNPSVSARALTTRSAALGGEDTIQAIASKVSTAPDALDIMLELFRKSDLTPHSIFLISSILKKVGIASPLAELQSAPMAVVTCYDALIEDQHVYFTHNVGLSGTTLIIVDVADPVSNCARTHADISVDSGRFPVADTAWLRHVRVACPAFVIVATA